MLIPVRLALAFVMFTGCAVQADRSNEGLSKQPRRVQALPSGSDRSFAVMGTFVGQSFHACSLSFVRKLFSKASFQDQQLVIEEGRTGSTEGKTRLVTFLFATEKQCFSRWFSPDTPAPSSVAFAMDRGDTVANFTGDLAQVDFANSQEKSVTRAQLASLVTSSDPKALIEKVPANGDRLTVSLFRVTMREKDAHRRVGTFNSYMRDYKSYFNGDHWHERRGNRGQEFSVLAAGYMESAGTVAQYTLSDYYPTGALPSSGTRTNRRSALSVERELNETAVLDVGLGTIVTGLKETNGDPSSLNSHATPANNASCSLATRKDDHTSFAHIDNTALLGTICIHARNADLSDSGADAWQPVYRQTELEKQGPAFGFYWGDGICTTFSDEDWLLLREATRNPSFSMPAGIQSNEFDEVSDVPPVPTG